MATTLSFKPELTEIVKKMYLKLGCLEWKGQCTLWELSNTHLLKRSRKKQLRRLKRTVLTADGWGHMGGRSPPTFTAGPPLPCVSPGNESSSLQEEISHALPPDTANATAVERTDGEKCDRSYSRSRKQTLWMLFTTSKQNKKEKKKEKHCPLQVHQLSHRGIKCTASSICSTQY